jgi:predicted transposase YdaD
MSTGKWEYKSDFARRYYGRGREEGREQGREEGRAEGATRALLGVLDARGIDVPDAARERILRCAELEQLETWVRRSVTVSTIDDLFAWRTSR